MKNGKRLTAAQRNYLETLKLNSESWLITKKTSENWHLVHRETGRPKVVPAP